MMRLNGFIGKCVVLLALLCLAACEVKRPKEVLSNEQMERVLYDYHMARAVGEVVGNSENYRMSLYVQDAFRKNGITQADFDTTMAWMARHPQHLTEIYENVNKRLRARRDGINALIAMNEEKPMDTPAGDSVNVWMWQQHYALNGMPLDNKISFNLPSDSNFQARDTLRWSIRFRFQGGVVPDSMHMPVMAMQITYDTDSVISAWAQVDSAGIYTLTLSADTMGPIQEVRGFVYYPRQTAALTLLADRFSLMRYHAKDTLSVGTDSLKNETLPATRTPKGTERNSDRLKPTSAPLKVNSTKLNPKLKAD